MIKYKATYGRKNSFGLTVLKGMTVSHGSEAWQLATNMVARGGSREVTTPPQTQSRESKQESRAMNSQRLSPSVVLSSARLNLLKSLPTASPSGDQI